MITLGVTGHRLGPRLGGFDLRTRRALGALAVEHLREIRPKRVITGMAIGWDQAVAGACVALDIPFVAAVPFPGQATRWPPETQARYRRLLESAESINYTCRSEQTLSARQVTDFMRYRNQWVVDNSDQIAALFDGSAGSGTALTVHYAQMKGKPIENLWSRWLGGFDPVDAVLG